MLLPTSPMNNLALGKLKKRKLNNNDNNTKNTDKFKEIEFEL